MPAIKMIMKYSNVFPILICMESVFFIIACDKEVSPRSLAPTFGSLSYGIKGIRNDDCDLIDLATRNPYQGTLPGSLPVVKLVPIQPDTDLRPSILNVMNIYRKGKLYMHVEKCELINCD